MRHQLIRSIRYHSIPGWLFVFVLAAIVGCQPFSGPENIENPGSGTGPAPDARIVIIPGDEPGPVLTVTNEYMDPIVSTTLNQPPSYMEIPRGTPLTFCLSAGISSGGGVAEAYRYGWDITDLNDPELWEIDFTPLDSREVCAPTRAFMFGTHSFHVEVIDDLGGRSRVSIIINTFYSPPSVDIMPGTCKNPLSPHKRGVVTAAIPGTAGIDVFNIDASTVEMRIDDTIIMPLKMRIRDNASPVINGESCDCAAGGADGIDDLMLTFSAAEIVAAMGLVRKGESRSILIHGHLIDGPGFYLRDCVTIVGNPPPEEEPSLENKDDVLATLEMAYNQKSLTRADAVFDDDFVFFFSPADVAEGKVPIAVWSRSSEMTATANLFGIPAPAIAMEHERPIGGTHDLPVSEDYTWGAIKYLFYEGYSPQSVTINLSLVYPPGEDTWAAVTPPDPTTYPGETWYEKLATYSLVVQMDDMTLMAFSIHTSFVVRPVGDIWRIVQWRDDIF